MTNILAISIFRSTSIYLLLVNCISRFKNDVRFIFTSGGLMSCLRYMCLFVYIVVSNTLCVSPPPLRLVYPMLPVSLYCLFLFFPPFVLCTLCYQFLYIVYFCFPLPLCLVYPMLPVSLYCPFLIAPSSCVHYVASFTVLSILDCPFVLCTLCCQFHCIVYFLLPLQCSLTFIYVKVFIHATH